MSGWACFGEAEVIVAAKGPPRQERKRTRKEAHQGNSDPSWLRKRPEDASVTSSSTPRMPCTLSSINTLGMAPLPLPPQPPQAHRLVLAPRNAVPAVRREGHGRHPRGVAGV